ncbi:MAG: DUF4003 family protein [Lachnospiraceae bacterium]|jgi:hypothetical protein|nr:DUF4003 family protein [Lachnospiraceae bacterium]
MKEKIRERCELLKINRKAIAREFSLENDLMSIVAAMIFTDAGREVDLEMLKECKKILAKHTGMFSRFRKNVDLVLESRMAMSDDPEKYIEAVIDTYNKIRKAKMKDNDFTIIAAVLLCELGKTDKINEVMERYDALTKRMEKEHPFLTDATDSSQVMLLAVSERDVDSIVNDIEECIQYLKKACKTKAGSDAVQGIGEVLALEGGNIKERCERVDKMIALFQEKKAGFSGDREVVSLGALADIDAEPEILVDQVIEAAEILKEDKAFSDSSLEKSRRIMYAAALVAGCYREHSAANDNAYISSTLGILKDRQTAAMISAMMEILPGIVEAVFSADK